MKKTMFMLCMIFSINCIAVESNPVKSSMDNEKLNELILRIDKKVQGKPGFWQLSYEGIGVYIITDERADRMRIISPVSDIDKIQKVTMHRMMQANFDSALDARYSIAKGKVWSAYIHPLSALSDKEFFSGLAQTITLVRSFGKSYSSGALIFKGGDSEDLNNKSYLEILRKGLSI
jgi:hypothetical protein